MAYKFISLILSIIVLLNGCTKNSEELTKVPTVKKTPSLELNQNQIKFVQNAVFEDSVVALNGGKSVTKRDRALHNYNIIQAVDAQTLSAEYNENEVAADQKFKKKGTYILLTGTVSRISKDFKGEPYVSIKGNTMFNEVQSKFGDADLAVLMKLKPGQKVNFVCEVSNKIITTVMLRECATIETHTEALRAGMDTSVLDVMEGKTKASQEGAESIASVYLIAKQLPAESTCFTKTSVECEKEVSELLKLPQSIENQTAFKNLVTKWSNGTN